MLTSPESRIVNRWNAFITDYYCFSIGSLDFIPVLDL